MRQAVLDLAWLRAGDARDDQRHPDAAFACIELEGVERRCGRAGPTRSDDAVGALCAELVDPPLVLPVQPQPGAQRGVVVRALGPVVGQKDEHRVVELADLLEVLDQSPYMVVHRVGHAGVDLHAPLLVLVVLCAQALPVAGGLHRRHRRSRRYQPQRRRLVAARLAQRAPAVLVDALVLVDECARRLDRHMVGLKAKVGKEGLLVLGAGVDVLDRTVDEVLGRVEVLGHHGGPAILEPVDLVHVRQVALGGFPVVRSGVALDDRAVEAAPIGQVVRFRADVPLAADIGTVAAVSQQRRHGDDALVQRAQVARFSPVGTRHRLAQVADAIEVVVDAGQQHRAGRRAGCAGMEVGEAGSAVRQRVEMGR